MKQNLFIFLSISLITLETKAEPVEHSRPCRESSVWESKTIRLPILDDERGSCRALCQLLEKSVPPKHCEHEIGGRGYDRTITGTIFQDDQLACMKYGLESYDPSKFLCYFKVK